MERVVLNKVESIERCIMRLKELYRQPEKITEYLYQDAIVLNLQRACQQCIDLAMYFVSQKGYGIPKTSKEAFLLLEQNNIIDKKLSRSLQGMVGFRNIAIHQYQELELEVIKTVLENHLDDFLKFSEAVLRSLHGREDN